MLVVIKCKVNQTRPANVIKLVKGSLDSLQDSFLCNVILNNYSQHILYMYVCELWCADERYSTGHY